MTENRPGYDTGKVIYPTPESKPMGTYTPPPSYRVDLREEGSSSENTRVRKPKIGPPDSESG